ncbi:MAG TPA: LytTR family transcriptional regulator DNA-binding domain-containing protein [Opitutaceae bacterium]|nr:LytTR family transcriptional regulator DNA-binding domain-containing protein [Opitutaceae bacterium]
MKIRTLIIDDEPLAREGIAVLCAADPEIEIVGQSSDGATAVQAIRREHPELIFLDVQMPKKDGFEVLESLTAAERPVVVFVTAYDQYAIRAFEASAVDYLLKPYTDKRFQQALARAKNELRRNRTQEVDRRLEELLVRVNELRQGAPAAATPAKPEYAERIVVKAGGDLHFVKTSDVLWIEAQGDFVKVQTLEQPQLVRETLQSMEQKLDASRFLRIHRSFLVNVQHIKRVAPALYGDHTVFMSDGSKLRLSRNYRSKLKAFIGPPPA